MISYADTPDKIAEVVKALDASDAQGIAVGLDTEFSGVRVGQESTYAKSRLHLLSVAIQRTGPQAAINPRGYPVADAVVFTREALPALAPWLAGPGIKVIHNAGVDVHTLANEGYVINGVVNTLDIARYTWPERARGAGFTLDSLGADIVGEGKTEQFEDIFTEEVTQYRVRTKRVTFCECGTQGCRKRATSPGHRRLERTEETRIPYTARVTVPLESVVPGHALWDRALKYAAQDALLALAIYTLARNQLRTTEREVPWLDKSMLESLLAAGSSHGATSPGSGRPSTASENGMV